MQGGRTKEFRTTLIILWTLLGGYELHTWLAGDKFPPGPIMSLTHVGLATVTVVYAIAKRERSAKANFELGREVEREIPTSRGTPNLRAVDEVSAR